MTTPLPATSDKIQPNPRVDDSRTAPRRCDLREATREVLRAGAAHKADLVRFDAPDGPVVVKDFSRKPWFWRRVGRLQLRRELAAYRHMGSIAGVPRAYGLVDDDALALEWVDGDLLKTLPDRVERGAYYVDQLERIAAGIHTTGLVHLDLRSNNNIVVRRDGRVFVLDFASAVRLRPGSALYRLLFRSLRALDVSGILKWKRCLLPEGLTESDRARIARHARLSSFWFLNRKQRMNDAVAAPGQNPEPADASTSADGA